jgi:hypothetical protein
MFGICSGGKMKIIVGSSVFDILEVNGPIQCGDKCFPSRIRYAEREIHLLKSLPENVKKYVLAAAVSEACLRHRIPLIWPKWLDSSL